MTYQFGEILLLSFPFSDTGAFKKRPALVLLDSNDDDVVVCRITSVRHFSSYDVFIQSWQQAGLLTPSTIRVHKIATLKKTLVDKRIGHLNQQLKEEVINTFQSFV